MVHIKKKKNLKKKKKKSHQVPTLPEIHQWLIIALRIKSNSWQWLLSPAWLVPQRPLFQACELLSAPWSLQTESHLPATEDAFLKQERHSSRTQFSDFPCHGSLLVIHIFTSMPYPESLPEHLVYGAHSLLSHHNTIPFCLLITWWVLSSLH